MSKHDSPESLGSKEPISVEEWIAMGEEEELAEKQKKEKKKKEKKPLTVGRVFKRIGIISLISLLSIVVIVVSGFLFMFYSPWTTVYRDQYILMTYNTSNPWLCTLFFSQETIDQVYLDNGSVEPDGEINTDLVNTDNKTSEEDEESEETPPKPEFKFKTSEKYESTVVYDDGEVQIRDFSGKTQSGKYTAHVMQVKDPSRVFLGMTKYLGDKNNQAGRPGRGQTVTEMCKDNDALCGINAGGFMDPGGGGSGGIPLGGVVIDGEYAKYGQNTAVHKLIGFNEDDVLVVCENTKEDAEKYRLRDAVSWRMPVMLVMNGEQVEYKGLAGGFDPRAAIGQCADGSVILLVVDGSSLRGIDGANFALMADIMYEFGAVNAANIDGGTSACMSLNGEVINTVCNPNIAKRGRNLATTWLVKNLPSKEEE